MKMEISINNKIRCAHCKNYFNIETGARIKGNYYCGYCESSVFGPVQYYWPPTLGEKRSVRGRRGYSETVVFSKEDFGKIKKIGHITDRP